MNDRKAVGVLLAAVLVGALMSGLASGGYMYMQGYERGIAAASGVMTGVITLCNGG